MHSIACLMGMTQKLATYEVPYIGSERWLIGRQLPKKKHKIERGEGAPQSVEDMTVAVAVGIIVLPDAVNQWLC